MFGDQAGVEVEIGTLNLDAHACAAEIVVMCATPTASSSL
jgi:hypothetical protein